MSLRSDRSMEAEAYLKRIGTNIKVIRESKGISQVDLAYICNFEKPNMSRIESGNTNPTIKTLIKIAKALDVHVLDLLQHD